MCPEASTRRSRKALPHDLQVRVLYRDGWLCRWCHRPVVFAPAFRLLEDFVKRAGHRGGIAYYHNNWSRAGAPLLDHLGAVIDHVDPFSRGGADDESNFAVACNKCNTRKNARQATDFQRENPGKPVKGKYGEPKDWDGLASLFVVLARQGAVLLPGERQWLEALERHQAK